MGTSTQRDRIGRIADKLMEHASDIERSRLRSFGYRERLAIERLLFLLLKNMCSIKLQYNLQGLTEVHRLALLDTIKKSKGASEINRLITRVFELRVFLYSLSSANPYVQGDTLSRVELTKRNVTNFTAGELRKTAKLALEL